MKDAPKEAHVVINGVTLTEAQSMAVRVAIESFDSGLRTDGLGKDEMGVAMAKAYMERIEEIRSALYQ